MAVAVETSQKFVEALNQKFPADEFSGSYDVLPGRKYDKVTIGLGNQRSVHAFVERGTGLLYKAAGWAAPAKGARYDLSTEEGLATTVERADRYGSYLYKG